MHWSLLKRFPLFFDLCLPVSSVSNFRPETGGRRWSLVWVCLFSHAVGREARCRQISLACVGRTHSVPATLGLPRSRVSVLSPSTLLRLPAAPYGVCPALRAVPVFRFSTKAQTQVGPAFCAFPGPTSSGSQELDARTVPGCGAPSPSVTSQVHAPCA